MKSGILVLLLSSAFATPVLAGDPPVPTPTPSHRPNPGNTGAYAFSFIEPARDAHIEEMVTVDLRYEVGKDHLGRSQGTILRVEIPFAQWISVDATATLNSWQITSETQKEYGFEKSRGVNFGDINAKTKIRILREKDDGFRPDLSFMATVKTASGQNVDSHRFTDSAGYEFSILASKDLRDDKDALLRKIRILSEVAFSAWDTKLNEQNDAWKVSTGVLLESGSFRWKTTMLYYVGWQDTREDEVLSIANELQYQPSERWRFYTEFQIPVTRAAPGTFAGVGVRRFLDAPKRHPRPPKPSLN